MERICMYHNRFPDENDTVVVKVVEVDDVKSSVRLLEFGQKPGIILHSELSRKRFHSVYKHIKEGNTIVLQVLRVDRDKGYIDLSKKHLKPNDIETCLERYRKSKAIHSIVGQVAKQRGGELAETMEQIYSNEVWPLYDDFDHPYDAFQAIACGHHEKRVDLHDDDLLQEILKRMKPKVQKFNLKIQIRCYHPSGIEIIKAAIKKAVQTNDRVRVLYEGAPDYSLQTKHVDEEIAQQWLQEVFSVLQNELQSYGGVCTKGNDAKAEIKAIQAMTKHKCMHPHNFNKKVGRFTITTTI